MLVDNLQKIFSVSFTHKRYIQIYARSTGTGTLKFAMVLKYKWRNILTGGPLTNYIKGPIPHFEFTEEFIIIKVLSKITIKHKTMMKCE